MDVVFTGTDRKTVIIALADGEQLANLEGPGKFYAKVDTLSPVWVELLQQRVKVIDPVMQALGEEDAEIDIAAGLDDKALEALSASDAPSPSIYPYVPSVPMGDEAEAEAEEEHETRAKPKAKTNNKHKAKHR